MIVLRSSAETDTRDDRQYMRMRMFMKMRTFFCGECIVKTVSVSADVLEKLSWYHIMMMIYTAFYTELWLVMRIQVKPGKWLPVLCIHKWFDSLILIYSLSISMSLPQTFIVNVIIWRSIICLRHELSSVDWQKILSSKKVKNFIEVQKVFCGNDTKSSRYSTTEKKRFQIKL